MKILLFTKLFFSSVPPKNCSHSAKNNILAMLVFSGALHCQKPCIADCHMSLLTRSVPNTRCRIKEICILTFGIKDMFSPHDIPVEIG